MSSEFKPREVEPQPHVRWAKATGVLITRSPVAFGVLLAGLLLVDPTVSSLVGPNPSREVLALRDTLAALAAPFVLAAAVLVGRYADLGQRPSLRIGWGRLGVLAAGLAAISLVLRAGLPSPPAQVIAEDYAQLGGRLCMNWSVVQFLHGGLVVPLVAIGDVPLRRAWWLSFEAVTINELLQVDLFAMVAVMVVATNLWMPYGIPVAALFIFLGAYQYVAYRDIFEQRANNAPTCVANSRSVSPAQP